MLTLLTERLMLRNFYVHDANDLYNMRQRFEQTQYAQYDHQWPSSLAEIERITQWFSQGDNYLAVCLKDTHEFIGFVSITTEQMGENKIGNLGYCFSPQYHGKGYATEACRCFIEHAFHHWDIQQIITGTAAVNEPSCRLLEKLGFIKVEEGKASFRKDKHGKPIEFIGYEFLLSKEKYLAEDRER